MKTYNARKDIVADLMKTHHLTVEKAERLDVFHQIYVDLERGLDTRTAVMNILRKLMEELET